MNSFAVPFIPGFGEPEHLPLDRYLPPLPAGMTSAWLNQQLPQTALILDPLGSSPDFAFEAARSGYRMIVVSNNPIISFLIETIAQAPHPEDIQAALAELGSSRRGDERLEVHLQSLYMTDCSGCGTQIPAEAFLWRKGEDTPFGRVYHCLICGDEGERPVTQRDIERLAMTGRDSLHRSRAIERVTLGDESLKESAREAIDAYLPRPLYVLFTILNRIQGLGLPEKRKRLLSALAISICDEANTMWAHPAGRTRPRQIFTPPQFRENNLWQAMERAAILWSKYSEPIPLTHWPAPPPSSGGLCLYQGRLKGILPFPDLLKPQAAATVFLRPNQAFWTLSAVWSGWLWGKDQLQPLKIALERRRYDWHWHTSALHNILSQLRQSVPPDFPLFGILPEIVPGFFAAANVAAETSGFHLQSLALQKNQEVVQASWKNQSASTAHSGISIESALREGIRNHLTDVNQPENYQTLQMAGLVNLDAHYGLTISPSPLSREVLTDVQSNLGRVFSDKSFLTRVEQHSQEMESGVWWLAKQIPKADLTLADRLEIDVVRYLQKNPGCTESVLFDNLCKQFTGLITPTQELLQVILESYAEPSNTLPIRWELRESESPAARRSDLNEIKNDILQLGKKFGYLVEDEPQIEWKKTDGTTSYRFFVVASSIVSKIIFGFDLQPECQNVLVIPGSRSRLLANKLRSNPTLAQALSAGWLVVKFRHLRQIASRTDLDIHHFMNLLDDDPPSFNEPVQLSIF